MLAFISDLHFVDGTAGKHNLPSRAFDSFFDDLVAIANKDTNEIKEIKIVLLGDIFDLLRTENWFSYPTEERPWGSNEPAIEVNALTLFDAIAEANRQSFETIRQRLSDLRGRCRLHSDATLIYLPGNHDRLCNWTPRLRKKVCDCLGLPAATQDPADLFLHTYEDLAYGVFARHGHEYDKFNY